MINDDTFVFGERFPKNHISVKLRRRLEVKKNLLCAAAAIMSLFVFSSCTNDNPVAAADPSGTITTNINYYANPTPITLYQGLADDGPYQGGWGVQCPYLMIVAGMNVSLNFVFNVGINGVLDFSTNQGTTWYSGGTEVADVGKVNGLGDVTTKPTSGWASTCAIQVGHGYVIRFKKSKNYATANLPYLYARIYVVEWVEDVSNEIIGAKMKYQVPF